MSSWHSPQSIFAMGHRAIRDLFTVPVQVQEKVDGSFFAFGKYPEGETTPQIEGREGLFELKIRSKGAVMVADAPEKMFALAAKAVKDREQVLHPGWMYRGEFLAKPKHNALAYDRAPKDNVILFDILIDDETYLPYPELVAEGERIGLEVVPQLFCGMIGSAEELRQYLNTVSVLGGQKIEGVVVKPIEPLFGLDKKALYGKFVSEAYKEVHAHAWKQDNPTMKDIISQLGDAYGTQARWQKALQHCKERGVIEGSPRDIAFLIREVPDDIYKECADEIKEKVFAYAWGHMRRMITRGLPEWYKDLLLREQFEAEPTKGSDDTTSVDR